jgi:hypothetical protein
MLHGPGIKTACGQAVFPLEINIFHLIHLLSEKIAKGKMVKIGDV